MLTQKWKDIKLKAKNQRNFEVRQPITQSVRFDMQMCQCKQQKQTIKEPKLKEKFA